ncbi:hypothetical protein GCM10023185_27150 [Hymenobacter saemangeumensis]|uniref:DUF2029 domain-containing protein n=1 Tax=Hymenobacter saemangeumensis TaxID=1084522 RepID=A0ABP8IJ30_9BACT
MQGPVLGARSRQWLFPWLLALAALANLAYPLYQHYDVAHSIDPRSYLRMASGRFDSVSVTRRYRVLVPAAAAAVAAPIASIYARVWPQRPEEQWPLRFAFYLVNCGLLAAAGACWFRSARLSGASSAAAALALLAALSSRWAAYIAGLPLTDSLYLLVFGLSYYAVKRGKGAGWALVAALLLGPLAKESFCFLLPWVLWFGRAALSWPRQLLALTVGLVALACVHVCIDSQIHAQAGHSLTNALEHLANISYSLQRAASVKGLGELLSIFGLFTLVPFLVLVRQKRKGSALALQSAFGFSYADAAFLLVVAVHMLLSGDLGRMGYLAAPVFVAMLSLAFTHWHRTLGPGNTATA